MDAPAVGVVVPPRRLVRWRSGAVWSPFALVVGLGACTLGLMATNGRGVTPGGVATSVAYGGVAAWIAARRRGHGLVPVLWTVAATEGTVAAAHAYATRALDVAPGTLPAGAFAAWLSDWLWFPGYLLLLTLVILLFPDGRLPSRRWRPVVWVVIGAVGLMVAAALTELPDLAARTSIEVTGEGEEAAELLGATAMVLALLCTPLCLASLVVRWRRATGVQRRQLKTFLLGATASVALLVALLVVDGVVHLLIGLLAAVAMPAAIGVAVVRHNLFDVDLVLNRTLVYAVLTGLVVGGYVGVVAAAQWLFDLHGTAPSVVAAGLIAAAFQPARERAQRNVNRLLYGRRDDPYTVLSTLGRQLGEATTDALDEVVGSVADALRVPHVRIETPGPPLRVLAQHGDRLDGTTRVPLLDQGETLGWLTVAPRTGEDELAVQDRRLLEGIAPQIAVTVHARSLAAQVQRSREALRLALEDERRRIRRDVHDGLGPTLATVIVGLERLRNLGDDVEDPDADDLVTELKAQTQQALAGMRALVNGLRPPALDNLGLVGAVRAHADSLRMGTHDPPLTITVETSPEPFPELPAALEVAVYRIVMEALTNVVRHAQATACTVRIDAEAALRVAVDDDGHGLPPTYTAGVGLRAIRERAAELGGTATIEPLDPGLRVAAVLPLTS
jgi:two-component system, NarL family, sensor kinase